MPLIQVIAPENTLEKNDQDALMSRVSNAVLRAERAPVDDAGAQSLVWAYYHEMNSNTIYVGGENPQIPPFRIAITTPDLQDRMIENWKVDEVHNLVSGHFPAFSAPQKLAELML